MDTSRCFFLLQLHFQLLFLFLLLLPVLVLLLLPVMKVGQDCESDQSQHAVRRMRLLLVPVLYRADRNERKKLQ